MSSRSLVAACIALAGLAACSTVAPGEVCSTNGDCERGETCLDGQCQSLCNSAMDCPDGGECGERGVCQPAECGNGLIAASEECDAEHPGCLDCVLQPGFVCSAMGCSLAAYRVALANDLEGTIDVVDIAADGIANVIRHYASGHRPSSPWPEWSRDGTQLAYPSGADATPGCVYLYDVPTRTTTAYTSFDGDQPSFAPHRLELVGRYNEGFVTYNPDDGPSEVGLTGFTLQWPKWDPTLPSRFAFVDNPGMPDANRLVIHQLTGELVVVPDGVMGFDWSPQGTLYYLQDIGDDCAVRRLTADSTGVTSSATVVTGVSCDAGVQLSPDGANLAVFNAARALTLISAAAQDLVFAEQTPRATLTGNILDCGWSPDNLYIAALVEVDSSTSQLVVVSAANGSTTDVVIPPARYVRLRISPETF